MSFVYLYPIMAVAPSVLLFTGHLLDAANRETTRFPHSMLDEAKLLISKSIDELAKVNSISVAIASLGAGGDMLFAAEVLKRNVRLHIFIPTEKGQFIDESVTYLKSVEGEDAEAWKLEFDRILALADIVVFTKPDHAEQNPYAACNTKMLQHAFELAPTERGVVGLALVKPGEEKIEGGAAHFLQEMRSKHVPVQILWPGEQNVVPADVRELSRFIPLFKHLDEEATFYQSRWRSRLKFSLLVLRDVAQAAERIAGRESVSPEEKKLIQLAALLHDIGFIHGEREHEARGAEMVRELLPQFGFDTIQIETIANMILATKLPQYPQTLLEKILCDADLDYLGRDDFFEISNKLFQEMTQAGVVENQREWNLVQRTFLQGHRYHTEYSKGNRETGKQQRLNEIVEQLKTK